MKLVVEFVRALGRPSTKEYRQLGEQARYSPVPLGIYLIARGENLAALSGRTLDVCGPFPMLLSDSTCIHGRFQKNSPQRHATCQGFCPVAHFRAPANRGNLVDKESTCKLQVSEHKPTDTSLLMLTLQRNAPNAPPQIPLSRNIGTPPRCSHTDSLT
ncbi:uncharacterized protein CC84DRAFT_901472 [Paraphaeosphaeria sporulosa]|uniref:Uncharacterized protein n=1 Tax=Paraphaeosphaeria sporulosa TaxID=1460663 RepID=A0A177C517_9PLEO|nr:uncharacterized protein CC84DRAFT_901472 [Paraphaeosphaeria sporulosa]OAG02605.1 hypothetical protein CC84DRAFT_901472 [Paraphaeosphaeria sporulosa]